MKQYKCQLSKFEKELYTTQIEIEQYFVNLDMEHRNNCHWYGKNVLVKNKEEEDI